MAVSKADQKEFAKEIKILREDSDNFLEAITKYCAARNLDVLAVVKLLNGAMKTKMAKEARELHLIKHRKKRKKK